MLSCCDADGEILSVPEFFAVGKTFRALFWCAVKGGGHCQFLNISVIYKVHLRRVPRPSVFINHLTLPLLVYCNYLLLFTAAIPRGVFTRIPSENPELNGAKRCFLPFLCIAKRVTVRRTAFYSGAVNSDNYFTAYIFVFGSSASLMPLPIKLIDRIVITSASPGGTHIHGRLVKIVMDCALYSIFPQEAAGG